MKLSLLTERKFIESFPGNGRMILTPNGYVEILEVHKTIKYPKFKIILENGLYLEGAHNHVIIDENYNEIYIKDSLGHNILTEVDISKVIEVIDLNVEEHMYDISIDSTDELYYSNGILSHNSGKTVTVGIFLTWCAIFKRDINVGICANRGKTSKEFLDKVKKIYIELPIWLQTGIVTWNKTWIETENGVRLMTDVFSETAFRGFSCHMIVGDECVDYNETVTIKNMKTGFIETIKIGDLYQRLNIC